jgi:outer membrane protein assembly factor BamA
MEIVRDARPNRFYPIKGSLVDFTGDFFAQSLGGKYSLQSYRVTFNKYWGLSDKQVLAYNGFFCGTGGQPSFYGNCIYAANNELRGVATLRGGTSIATCLPRNWNIAWSSRGVGAWLALAASAKLLSATTASARISSCPPEAPAFVFCKEVPP